jgi:hypothetical protein
MTQEEKQLLIRDLCARIPYGFTIHRYSDNRDITFEPNELDEFAHFLEYSEGKEFKPYLRSMSSMTEEEKLKLEDMEFEIAHLKFTTYAHECMILDYLYSRHLDVRGLIPMGLALEAPKGMYESV